MRETSLTDPGIGIREEVKAIAKEGGKRLKALLQSRDRDALFLFLVAGEAAVAEGALQRQE